MHSREAHAHDNGNEGEQLPLATPPPQNHGRQNDGEERCRGAHHLVKLQGYN